MSSRTPGAGTPVATGIASGSLGTGTAVDDETTVMAVPDVPESTMQPEVAPLAPAAPPAPAARRDPYRPIGIALAVILVALAGAVALSSGGDTPAQVGAPPAAAASPGNDVAGDDEDGDKDDGDKAGNNGNGNGRGNGKGNGNGGENGRGNDD
jgi:hypothetical protein